MKIIQLLAALCLCVASSISMAGDGGLHFLEKHMLQAKTMQDQKAVNKKGSENLQVQKIEKDTTK
ncbi:hypothetical protein A3K93_05960 [Acinetobacter sp. NCu2D-2]|uniref:hypothetical protein n=1 Tax=Acinetobacter sp. NCu2D-2 TaxID=1608473 RepID=UPI0007CDAD02|nr:hypothetical protein [Acinetobacter sp. NCu2D-2]ANF81775.1 hypothetical protein A3K93_05960 [Acinetobacter sp. NCu2D-2]